MSYSYAKYNVYSSQNHFETIIRKTLGSDRYKRLDAPKFTPFKVTSLKNKLLFDLYLDAVLKEGYLIKSAKAGNRKKGNRCDWSKLKNLFSIALYNMPSKDITKYSLKYLRRDNVGVNRKYSFLKIFDELFNLGFPNIPDIEGKKSEALKLNWISNSVDIISDLDRKTRAKIEIDLKGFKLEGRKYKFRFKVSNHGTGWRCISLSEQQGEVLKVILNQYKSQRNKSYLKLKGDRVIFIDARVKEKLRLINPSSKAVDLISNAIGKVYKKMENDDISLSREKSKFIQCEQDKLFFQGRLVNL